jgi:hypothetical protein
MNTASLQRAPTFVLKAILVLIGLGVLALCMFAFPTIWVGADIEWSQLMGLLRLALVGIFASAIPFFIALSQAFKLLHLIDKNNAFSDEAVKALAVIKYCAIVFSALYMTIMPLAVGVAELDDAPGAVVIAFAIACSPLIVATFVAVVQRLLQSAVAMKAEQDFTV